MYVCFYDKLFVSSHVFIVRDIVCLLTYAKYGMTHAKYAMVESAITLTIETASDALLAFSHLKGQFSQK